MRAISALCISITAVLAGCTPSKIVSTEYSSYEYSGEPLWVVPFAIEHVSHNRIFLPRTQRDTISVEDDSLSMASRFATEFFVDAMVSHSAFEDVELLTEVDSTDWEVRSLLPPTMIPADRFEVRLPLDGERVGGATSGFVLLLYDVALDERRRFLAPGHQLPRTAAFDFVLWHAADGKPYAWGPVQIGYRFRRQSEEQWRDLAEDVAKVIVKGTAFETDEPPYWAR